jgi:predicted transcriptional regulator
MDRALERGAAALAEHVAKHMTTDHVEAGPDPSDAQLAETFLHHRVLIVPICEHGQVSGIVTRNDFFRALAERLRA